MNRNQKILAVVAVLIIALYITGVSTQKGSGDLSDPTQNDLVQTLGRWFGSPDPVALEEVSGACLAARTLTIEGSCVITVKASDKDLRDLALKPDAAAHLKTRAPHDDSVLEKDLEAGKVVKVAVDDKGAEITFSCDKCTIVLEEEEE